MSNRGPCSIFRDRAVERTLREAADIGVAILRKYHGRKIGVENKGAVDLVTRADREAEERVFKYLAARHPGHALIGEESWDGSCELGAGYTWILDPLDGTTNYAHGLDHYAFSLGLMFDGEPVAGIVVDPQRDHVYRALRGRGAFRNRKRLRVSGATRLGHSLMATGFPYDRRHHLDELFEYLREFLLRSRGIRRMGVASLDLALVAAGQIDGYYEKTLHAWDVAAGMLLVTEAGGRITDFAGRKFDPFGRTLVASAPGIHRAIIRVIKPIRAKYEAAERG